MSIVDDLVDEITKKIVRIIGASTTVVLYGAFVEPEANSNYCHINIEGRSYRMIGKLASVTGLVAGNTCVIISGGSVPMTIVGKL